ncbi:hypothetical protein U9M48_026458 [Paspalum notatum var. saurae]|uniref:Uncharacterized protein n=1 Tax=Paspalum notatum var. saurae TaxID=547442 RepID=A0AAQ3WYC2_PASNO
MAYAPYLATQTAHSELATGYPHSRRRPPPACLPPAATGGRAGERSGPLPFRNRFARAVVQPPAVSHRDPSPLNRKKGESKCDEALLKIRVSPGHFWRKWQSVAD